METREVEGGGDEGKGDFFYVPTRAILGWPLLLGVTSTDVVVATSEEALVFTLPTRLTSAMISYGQSTTKLS